MNWMVWAGGGVLITAVIGFLYARRRDQRSAARKARWEEIARGHFYQCRFEKGTASPVADTNALTPSDFRRVAAGRVADQGLDPDAMTPEARAAALDEAVASLTWVTVGGPDDDRRKAYEALLARSEQITRSAASHDELTIRAAEQILHTPIGELRERGVTVEEKFQRAFYPVIGRQPLSAFLEGVDSVLGVDAGSPDFDLDVVLRLRVASERLAKKHDLWQMAVFRALAGIPQKRDDDEKVAPGDLEGLVQAAASKSSDRVARLVTTLDGQIKEHLYFQQVLARSKPDEYERAVLPSVWCVIAMEGLTGADALRFAFAFGLSLSTLGLGGEGDVKRKLSNLTSFWQIAARRFEGHWYGSLMGLAMRPGPQDRYTVRFNYRAHNLDPQCEARQLHESVWLLKDAFPTSKRDVRPSERKYFALFLGKAELPAAAWEVTERESIDLAQVAVREGTTGGRRTISVSIAPAGAGGPERSADVEVSDTGARLIQANGAMQFATGD